MGHTSVSDYKAALFAEINYLKKTGGVPYHVSNGVLIRQTDIEYTYCFDLETELYVSDDSPITLIFQHEKYKGRVLFCEEFQIFIIITRYLNKIIKNASISIEPWKLLEALSSKISSLDASDRIAMKLMREGPQLTSNIDVENKIVVGQENAIQHALKEDITIIWGPPGTGKTYVIAEIAIKAMHEGKKVLVVSHSNISVDGIVNEIAKQMSAIDESVQLDGGVVLRFGYVHDERLSTDRRLVSHNFALSRNKELSRKMDELRAEKKTLKSGQDIPQKRIEIEKQMKAIRNAVHEDELHIVKGARILATTISKVTINSVFDDLQYDMVLFDEVSMAYVPHIWCAASYAREHLVCVGDFRQLPPIIQSNSPTARPLSKDIFNHLNITDYEGNIYYHPWMIMLNEQRRMHPDISVFPNKFVYRHLLKNHPLVEKSREHILQSAPFCGSAMQLIDLMGTYCSAFKDSNGSRFNILSAYIAFMTAICVEKNGVKDVCIISPYRAQTRLIRAMIQDYKKHAKSNIVSSTVHQFQGSERDVVIFDAVESYPAQQVGWLLKKNENYSVLRLINVAVTRSRGKFILIANRTFWRNKLKQTTHLLARLIEHIVSAKHITQTGDGSLQEFLFAINGGEDCLSYNDPNYAMEQILTDMKNAQRKIVLSIPDSRFEGRNSDIIWREVQNASDRGVKVLCKANNEKNLPDAWQSITYNTENAVFPIIAIDEKVIWYGLPVSRGEFKDKNYRYKTICHVILRLAGSHTVNFIQSATDLERIKLDGNYVNLTDKALRADKVKTEQMEKNNNVTNKVGFTEYIKHTKKCPLCGTAVTIEIGRSKKPYLQCTQCEFMDFLKKEDVDQYIYSMRVQCPICHSDLRARSINGKIITECTNGHAIDVDII